MSTGTVFILGIVVAAIVVLVCAPTVLQSSRALRRRFGPEFQRAVDEHTGDVIAARKELSERLYRYGDLGLQPLGATAREEYRRQWADLSLRRLNAPAEAVVEAEALITRLAADRGFPGSDTDQMTAALSVRHAWHVGGFRHLCAMAQRVRAGEEKTVDLSGALSGAEELFERLVSERRQGRRQLRISAAPRRHRTRRLPRRGTHDAGHIADAGAARQLRHVLGLPDWVGLVLRVGQSC